MSDNSREITRLQLLRTRKAYGFIAGVIFGAILQILLILFLIFLDIILFPIFNSHIFDTTSNIFIPSNLIWYFGVCIVGGLVGLINSVSRDRGLKLRLSQYELQESKEKYEMLVEKMEEGVLLEDEEGRITFVNTNVAKMLNYTKKELLGKPWNFIVSSGYLDQIKNQKSNRTKGVSSTYDCDLQTKSGFIFPVIITSTPIFSNNEEFKGILSVFMDMTEQRKLKKLQERFIASTSHELRTPVTVIKGYIDFLQKNPKLPSYKVDFIYTKLQSNVDRLSRLITNVHSLSKFDQDLFRINKTETDLDSFVQTLQEQNSFLYPTKSIIMNYMSSSDNVHFLLDQECILQVIHNLVDNAIKNSTKESVVEISIIRDPNNVRIIIQDSGEGIPIQQIFNLFQPFSHLDTVYSSKGTGIGLYIVKSMVMAHGGIIEVVSQEGYGTCFTITL